MYFSSIGGKKVDAVQYRGTLQSAHEVAAFLAALKLQVQVTSLGNDVNLKVNGFDVPKYMFLVRQGKDFGFIGAAMFTEDFVKFEEAKPLDNKIKAKEVSPEMIAAIIKQLENNGTAVQPQQKQATPAAEVTPMVYESSAGTSSAVLSPEQEDGLNGLMEEMMIDIGKEAETYDQAARAQWEAQRPQAIDGDGDNEDENEDDGEEDEFRIGDPIDFTSGSNSLSVILNGRPDSIVNSVLKKYLGKLTALGFKPPKTTKANNVFTIIFY